MTLLAAAMPLDTPEAGRPTIAAARSGDLAAFELLMRQHERLVLATALRMTGNLEDAKDISQEVFLKLYRNLAKVEAPVALPAWLYRVTVNACHDLRRRRPALAPVEMAEELVAAGGDPQASATEAERRRVLELSLRLLPEKERAALVLRDLEGSYNRRDGARVRVERGHGAVADFESADESARFRRTIFLAKERGARMKPDEAMDILREAHREPIPEAHFAAVRARVLSQIASERGVSRQRTGWYGFASCGGSGTFVDILAETGG